MNIIIQILQNILFENGVTKGLVTAYFIKNEDDEDGEAGEHYVVTIGGVNDDREYYLVDRAEVLRRLNKKTIVKKLLV